MNNKSKRCLFVLGNPGSNIGDIAAMEGIIYGIRKRFPDCDLSVSYSGIVETKSITNYVDKFFRDEDFFSKDKLLEFIVKMLISRKEELISKLKNADLIIFAPGSCGLHKDNLSHWIKVYLIMIIFKIYQKKIMFHGCSMGPFQGHKLFLNLILKNADIITLRDYTSINFLKLAHINTSRVTVTGDSALMIPTSIKEKHKKKKKTIGITPIEFSKFRIGDIKFRTDIIVDSFASTINYLYKTDRVDSIHFISHILEDTNEDMVLKSIINRIDKRISYQILNPRTAKAALGEYENIDFCISARHHGGAFALKMGIPAICIAYEHKAHGFFSQCELDEFVIDVNCLSTEVLILKVEKLLKEYEPIVSKIKKNIPEMEKCAEKNAEIIEKFLNM